MNDHSETRTLRLECLESRALLSVDGWGKFTQDVERSHHTERASEQSTLKRHDRHLTQEDSRGSERDWRESLDAARGKSQHRVRFEIRHDRVRLRFVTHSAFHNQRSVQSTLGSSSIPEGEAISDQDRISAGESTTGRQPDASGAVSNATPSLSASRPAVLEQRSSGNPAQPVESPNPSETPRELGSNQIASPTNELREGVTNRLPTNASVLADAVATDSDPFPFDNPSLTPLENWQGPADNAHSSVSSQLGIDGGWVDDIGFPDDLRFVPSQTLSPTMPSLLGMPSSFETVVPPVADLFSVVHDAAIESMSITPNALIDLSEQIVEFRATDAHSGLIDMGLRATLGVHRSLDVIEGDFNVDETDLRDLVLAALTREIDAESAVRTGAIRLPRVNYAGAALLAASLTTITHRGRRSGYGRTASPQCARPPRK